MFWNNADVDEDFILTSKVDGRPSENKIRRSLNKNTKNTKRWNLEQKYKEIQNNENLTMGLADFQADTFTNLLLLCLYHLNQISTEFVWKIQSFGLREMQLLF